MKDGCKDACVCVPVSRTQHPGYVLCIWISSIFIYPGALAFESFNVIDISSNLESLLALSVIYSTYCTPGLNTLSVE